LKRLSSSSFPSKLPTNVHLYPTISTNLIFTYYDNSYRCQDEFSLWDILFNHAQQNTENLALLLKYADYYSKPEMLIRNIPDGSVMKDFRASLMEAFQQVKLQLGILDNFKLLSKLIMVYNV
jgi:hypothetical protein